MPYPDFSVRVPMSVSSVTAESPWGLRARVSSAPLHASRPCVLLLALLRYQLEYEIV